MKRIVIIVNLLMACGTIFSQPKQNKGVFQTSENKFYNEIKKGIVDYNADNTGKKKVFKMDYTGMDIPRSVDEFTTVWCNNPLSQGRTGTCWCFATSSFYEAEIHRLTKQEIKLSELYIVYWEYVEKAREFVATRGESFFGQGSETNAVARMIKKYGFVPAASYSGMKDGQQFHDHKAMFNEMDHYLKTLERDNAWNEPEAIATIKSIMDFYIGRPPDEIIHKGKKMSPLAFMKNVAKISPDDYVNFMSLLEAPYYQKAEYKVPDNWWHSEDYNNVPLDEFMKVIDGAIRNGYSIAIGGDVSETGYDANNDVAMIPTYDIPSEYIDDHARQLRFSNGSTTDDHAIHIIGYLEKNKDNWYLIKDSGSGSRNGNNKGYYFYHEDYIRLKIMSFTVHKDAAKDVLKKMK